MNYSLRRCEASGLRDVPSKLDSSNVPTMSSMPTLVKVELTDADARKKVVVLKRFFCVDVGQLGAGDVRHPTLLLLLCLSAANCWRASVAQYALLGAPFCHNIALASHIQVLMAELEGNDCGTRRIAKTLLKNVQCATLSGIASKDEPTMLQPKRSARSLLIRLDLSITLKPLDIHNIDGMLPET